MCIAWAALNLSLFGASDRADKYVQDVINTHFTRLLYPYPPHPDITVVLLTDHALNTDLQQGRWPVRYDFHGRVLKAIWEQTPKAVFIDFMWLSQRAQNADGSYQDGTQLVRQLQNFKNSNIPVFLASSPAVRDNWKELDGLVKWVSVPLGFDVSDFVARRYPPNAKERPTDEDGVPTAAFHIAHTLCRLPDKPTATMDIVWSAQVNGENHAWMFPDQAPRTTGLADVLLKGHEGVAMDTPFNRTLFVRDLLNPVGESREERLKYYLHNKIVLYGANVQGVNDLVFTPARSIQPGVYFHAMALDNLLNWGPNYKSDEGTGTHPLQKHQWISLLAVIPAVILAVLLNHVSRQLGEHGEPVTRLQRLVCWGRKHPYLRFLAVTLGLLLWFGSIAFFEFRFLNYSASVVIGYLQVIVAGFFLEWTETIDKLMDHARKGWHWLQRQIPTVQ